MACAHLIRSGEADFDGDAVGIFGLEAREGDLEALGGCKVLVRDLGGRPAAGHRLLGLDLEGGRPGRRLCFIGRDALAEAAEDCLDTAWGGRFPVGGFETQRRASCVLKALLVREPVSFSH